MHGYYFKGSQMRDIDPITDTKFHGISKTQLKWFTKDNNVAEVYGAYNGGKGSVWIYELRRKHKLLNLSNNSLHREELLAAINDSNKVFKFMAEYALVIQNGLKIELPNSVEKFQIMLKVPFGMCSLENQEKIKRKDLNLVDDNTPTSNERLSFHNYDKLLALYMKYAFKETYDGYYADKFTSSFHKNLFHSEICLFETNGLIVTKGRYILVKKHSQYFRAFINYNTTNIIKTSIEYTPAMQFYIDVAKTLGIKKILEVVYNHKPVDTDGEINTATDMEVANQLGEIDFKNNTDTDMEDIYTKIISSMQTD